MTRERFLRRTGVCLAALAASGLAASVAQAAVHSLDGNVRLQIGNGLPIPITGQAIPEGRVFATANATIVQPTPGNGNPVTLPPGAFTAMGTPVVLPVFFANPLVFQVRTAVTIQFPQTMTAMGGAAGPVVFSAGNRTGGAVEAYCAGSGATPPFSCASPNVGFIQAGVNGLMRYTATKNQFGGPARGNAGGSADVAIRGGDAAPCAYAGGANPNCLATMGLATPQGTGAQGAPFGAVVGTAGMAPPSGRLYVTVTGAGAINAATPTMNMNPGLPNPATSFGGPWTTGMLTVSVTNNAGPTPSIFVMSGSDARAVNGAGALSLVAGSTSARLLSGPNANRGWINMQIGPPSGAHVPVMPIAGVAAFGALAALTGGYALRRRGR